MLNNPSWDFINHSVNEKRTKTEKLFTTNEKCLLLNKINNGTSNDLFILFELVFDFGFSVYQVSKLNVKDIHFKQNIIQINYNNKKKIKRLTYSFAKILENNIIKKGMEKHNFIVFNEFIETKKINRSNYLHLLLSNLILDCKELNDKYKYRIINIMDKERKSSLDLFIEPIIKSDLMQSLDESYESKYVFKLDFPKNENDIYSKNSKDIFSIDNFYEEKDNFESLITYKVFSYNDQPLFHLLLEEENEMNKNDKFVLFHALKKNKIKFDDNPIKELAFFGLIKYMNNFYIPPELNNKNMDIYKKLKSKTNKGFYYGLKLLKLEKNNYKIITKIDIPKNTLLFEIGGEIVEKEHFNTNQNFIYSIKYKCYIYCEGNEVGENYYLLQKKYANISYFLINSTTDEPNVEIKNFVNKENGSIVLLCYAITNINKGTILISKPNKLN